MTTERLDLGQLKIALDALPGVGPDSPPEHRQKTHRRAVPDKSRDDEQVPTMWVNFTRVDDAWVWTGNLGVDLNPLDLTNVDRVALAVEVRELLGEDRCIGVEVHEVMSLDWINATVRAGRRVS